MHTRRTPFPDLDFPDTLKNHLHSDTLLHLKKHHMQHDRFVGRARSQIKTRLSKRVINEKQRKDKRRQAVINRSSGKLKAKTKSVAMLTLKRQKSSSPQYSIFKKKQKELYNSHCIVETPHYSKKNRPTSANRAHLKLNRRKSAGSPTFQNVEGGSYIMSQKLTGCLSRNDLEMVLNKRQFLASNLRRPKSAPLRRKQREIHVEDTATSRSGIEMSSEIKNGNTDTEPDTIMQTQKGGAVLLPPSPSATAALKKVRSTLTRIVAEDIATRDATEYNELLGYLKSKNLEELANQEIREDALDYMLSERN